MNSFFLLSNKVINCQESDKIWQVCIHRNLEIIKILVGGDSGVDYKAYRATFIKVASSPYPEIESLTRTLGSCPNTAVGIASGNLKKNDGPCILSEFILTHKF